MAGTYTTVAIKNLTPHPDIGRILTKSIAAYESKNYSLFSDEMLLLMQKSMPIHVVKTGANQLLFFAGWELLSELRSRNITTIWAVIHEEEPGEIELWALQNELSKASFIRGDIGQKHQYFYELLDEHKALWGKIFALPRPRKSLPALQRLCDLTRGYARKFAIKNHQNDEQDNPLARLLDDLKKQDSTDD